MKLILTSSLNVAMNVALIKLRGGESELQLLQSG